ncbi:hypothetical protein SUGI_0559230 [Cryptomeria japonica]|nr:hypothetical protein SUGI_0559230 [Cryptomeria japonica]
MELVLKLGLVSSHPEPEKRLGIRTVLQILEGQPPFPSHQILWISYDTSCKDYGSVVVHITDEEVTADQLASVPVSVESATTSTSHGYDKDSDYDVGMIL